MVIVASFICIALLALVLVLWAACAVAGMADDQADRELAEMQRGKL